ncbi:MAG: NAD(P)H-hydrate epimerase [Planctomycetes bacterium]|nr:NAD(P)H-hydrate epimerase [Planctomycetota bacterium]
MSHDENQGPRALQPETMRELDRRAIEDCGIPGLVLMENAGQGAYLVAKELARRHALERVLVVAGRGNNGGDGLVVARHAHNEGLPVSVILTAGPDAFPVDGDAAQNLEMARGTGVRLIDGRGLPPGKLLDEVGLENTLVVDALLGTGLRGPARPPSDRWIEEINRRAPTILALDLPSGLDAASGDAPGPVIRAAVTATFGALKLGLLIGRGPEHSGELRIVPISIPRSILLEALEREGRTR